MPPRDHPSRGPQTLTIGPRPRDAWVVLAGVVPALLVLCLGTLVGAPRTTTAVVAVVVLVLVALLAVRRIGTTIGPEGVRRQELVRSRALGWDEVRIASMGRWEPQGAGGPGTGTGETWLYVAGATGSGAEVPLVSTTSLTRLASSPGSTRARDLWREVVGALELRGVEVRPDPRLSRPDLAAWERVRGS